jgi:hypothetical protein
MVSAPQRRVNLGPEATQRLGMMYLLVHPFPSLYQPSATHSDIRRPPPPLLKGRPLTKSGEPWLRSSGCRGAKLGGGAITLGSTFVLYLTLELSVLTDAVGMNASDRSRCTVHGHLWGCRHNLCPKYRPGPAPGTTCPHATLPTVKFMPTFPSQTSDYDATKCCWYVRHHSQHVRDKIV